MKKRTKKPAVKKKLEELKHEIEMDEHLITLQELEKRLETSLSNGLTAAQVQEKLDKFGLNELTPPAVTPEFLKFMKTLYGGFALLLWAGAILCFIAYAVQYQEFNGEDVPNDNLCLAIVLVVVVLVTGVFQYYQESKSAKIMNAFKDLIPYHAVVTREGQNRSISASELVIGDIVTVKFGDRVPADIRIISSSGLKVDNSSLTGESKPQTRIPECTNDNPLQTKNLAFFSTNAVEGTARGVVIRTGDDTLMGHIACLASEVGNVQTPLGQEITRFIHLITVISCVIGFTFFIISLVIGLLLVDAVIFLIGVIVANVPEGLLCTVTVSLSCAAKRMASKNCLVKNLEAVETLGSTSTICSDKTGTLTQNRMTVSHMWYDATIHDSDLSIDQSGKKYNRADAGWQALLQCAMLCSQAEFKPNQANVPIIRRECLGDASESAILRFAEIAYGDVISFRNKNQKVYEVPFNSNDKFQLSVHELETKKDGNNYVLMMKGAPERIIELCSTVFLNGATQQLKDDFRVRFENVCNDIGNLGERILAFCDLYMTAANKTVFNVTSGNVPLKGLRFLGLLSLIDPPRPNVPAAVATCHTAGIQVVMVTGDHPTTAKAIARLIGIISLGSQTPEELAERLRVPISKISPHDAKARVISGDELKQMSQEELDQVIQNYPELVFARTSPQQKLIIVEGFQRQNRVVAVTGDGVNDSPALKKADIGIAMGISGSDVSKQAAGMILLDDNFASIITGIEEGRRIFDNLKKSIAYTMAANIPELVPFLVYILCGIPLGLATFAMLCIDLGTDIVPSVSFAYEDAEKDIMFRQPRDPIRDKLVTCKLIRIAYGLNGVLEAIGGFFTYFVIYMQCGFDPWDLYSVRVRWDSKNVNDYQDSYGQEWTYSQRKVLEYTVSTAFFCSVVIMQWADLLISKTNRNSLLHQGLTTNWFGVVGLIYMTCFALVMSYCPGMDNLKFYPIMFYWWLPAMVFAVLFFVYEEIRKFFIRRSPGGWLDNLSCY